MDGKGGNEGFGRRQKECKNLNIYRWECYEEYDKIKYNRVF